LYTLKDRVLIGWISGALGLLTRNVYSYFAKLIGLAKFYIWQLSADLFMDQKYIKSFWGNTVGFLADIVFGGLLGIVFIYFLKYTNSKNIVIKGWWYGIAAWLFLFGMMLHNLPQMQTAPKEALGNFSAFIGHSIYGISMGIYVKILMKKNNLLNEGRS